MTSPRSITSSIFVHNRNFAGARECLWTRHILGHIPQYGDSATMTSCEGVFCGDDARQTARLSLVPRLHLLMIVRREARLTLTYTRAQCHVTALVLSGSRVVCLPAVIQESITARIIQQLSQGLYGLRETDIALVPLAVSAALALFYSRLERRD